MPARTVVRSVAVGDRGFPPVGAVTMRCTRWIGLTAALALTWVDHATGQDVNFRLPADEPNANCDIIRSVSYSPDGKLLAVGYGRYLGLLQESAPGETVIWDVQSGKRKTTFVARKDGVRSVAFSPDGHLLAAAEYTGAIRLWEVSTGRERRTIEAPALILGEVAFHPDGKRIAAGMWTGSHDGDSPPGNDVIVWDVETAKPVHTLKGHTDAVAAVAFSPNGELLASGGWDGIAKVWDAASGRSLGTLEFPALKGREVKALAAIPKKDVLHLIHLDTVAFSPDSRTLVTPAWNGLIEDDPPGPGEVTLWDTPTLQVRTTLKGYTRVVSQVAFSPDGKLLATAGYDGLIRFWDSATHREVGAMRGAPPITFSPDGKELVSSIDGTTLAARKVVLRP